MIVDLRFKAISVSRRDVVSFLKFKRKHHAENYRYDRKLYIFSEIQSMARVHIYQNIYFILEALCIQGFITIPTEFG